MRFKVGEKVIVKSFSERPDHWNISGKMDKWMGKIVTILKYRESDINPYLIEEDKGENLGGRWRWRESDFLPIPKPGDKVKIRTWEDMEKQYGLDRDRDINTPLYSVVRSMKKYCGTIVTVKRIGSEYFVITNDVHKYSWGFETIEQVYPKEDKMEFTKDMLKSGEHVVEYRNGKRALYINGYFVNDDGYMNSKDYDCSLIETKYGRVQDYDIAAVYKITMYSSFNNILNRYIERIWKRDEEPIEIPSSEAFAQLREIYGKEVKIVEDRDE